MKTKSPQTIVELRVGNIHGISVQEMEMYDPTVIRITVGTTSTMKMKTQLMEGIIKSIPDINKILIPKNLPSDFIELAFLLMRLENVTYHYIDSETEALKEGLYYMKIGHFPTEDTLPTPINDGFKPFPTSDQGRWDGIADGFKPVPGSIEDVKDGYKDISEVQPEKREMWTEDPERMNRLSYVPLAIARGEKVMPEELGGGRI